MSSSRCGPSYSARSSDARGSSHVSATLIIRRGRSPRSSRIRASPPGNPARNSTSGALTERSVFASQCSYDSVLCFERPLASTIILITTVTSGGCAPGGRTAQCDQRDSTARRCAACANMRASRCRIEIAVRERRGKNNNRHMTNVCKKYNRRGDERWCACGRGRAETAMSW